MLPIGIVELLAAGKCRRQICRSAGYGAELTNNHWLAKIHDGECFLDLIFHSGNGVCAEDDEWFSTQHPSVVLEGWLKLSP